MSLPASKVKNIRTTTRACIEKEMQKNRKIIIEKQKQLKGIEENLFSVEEKWIKNKISQETYNRWHSTYNTDIKSLNSTIERLSTDQRRVFKILENKLDLLTDLSYVYNSADTLQKGNL